MAGPANAFTPLGNTVAIDVAATATTGVTAGSVTHQCSQRMLFNAGPNTAFVAWGESDIAAVMPIPGTPANGIPIAAGAIVILTFPPAAYFSAICDATETASIFITPGEGN